MPEEYAVGHGNKNRSANGGVALGYGYDDKGVINPSSCEGTIWSTGEILRLSTPPDPRLQAGGEIAVHGLQGTAVANVKPANTPPLKTYFIDFDDEFDDPTFRGHMGQVAIWTCDRTLAVASGQQPPGFGAPGGPGRPSGPPQPRYPDLVVSKEGDTECEAGSTCGFLITVTNRGARTFDGPVFLADNIRIPGLAGVDVNFLATTMPGCRPTELPFTCHPHLTLGAGASRTFHVILDIPLNTVQPGGMVRGRNCAYAMNPEQVPERGLKPPAFWRTAFKNLNSANPAAGPGFSCVDFVVRRPGPQPPKAGACAPLPVAEVKMTPEPSAIFNGPNQRIKIKAEIRHTGNNTFDGIDNWRSPVFNPPLVNVTCWDPPGGRLRPGITQFCEGTYVTTPADVAAVNVPLNVTVNGDCKGDPIVPVNAGTTLRFSRPQPAAACAAELTMTPQPTTFAGPNERINVKVEIRHTGANKVDEIANWSPPTFNPPLINASCAQPPGGTIRPGTSVFCEGTYVTRPEDVAARSVTLNATGNGQCGATPIVPVNASTTLAHTQPQQPPKVAACAPLPVAEAKMTPQRATFTAAGERIPVKVEIRHTGNNTFDVIANWSPPTFNPPLINASCDQPPGGTIRPGISVFCEGTYVTRPDDVAARSVTLNATGKGDCKGDPIAPINASTTLTWQPPPVPAPVQPPPVAKGPPVAAAKPVLQLAFGCTPPQFANVGTPIACTFTVTNMGNAPAQACRITSPPHVNLVCPGPVAANGGQVQVTAIFPANVPADIPITPQLTWQ